MPAAPPYYLSARNLSSTSLQVQWDPIPFGFRNGKILQYQVKYSQYSLTRRRVFTTNYAKKRSLTLVNLKKYKKYLIEVSGMTRKGVGPPVSTVVQTDEDGKDNTKSYTHKLARKSYLPLLIKMNKAPSTWTCFVTPHRSVQMTKKQFQRWTLSNMHHFENAIRFPLM